jgi:hypothetical protein
MKSWGWETTVDEVAQHLAAEIEGKTGNSLAILQTNQF